MKHLKLVSCSALLLLSFVMSFQLAIETENFYDSVSLRYRNGVSEEQVESVIKYLKSEESDKDISATFWKEEQLTVSTFAKELEVSAIRFLGDGRMAYYASFIEGGYPLTEDKSGCAISDSLAWELFGSNDIVSQKFTYQDELYTVRGVFKEKNELLLLTGENNSEYSSLELSGDLGDNEHQTVVDFAINSGLELPSEIVFGTSITQLLYAICYLPLMIAFVLVAINVFVNLRKSSAVTKETLFFFSLLIFAVSTPLLLSNIPQWLLPTQWSDFSFWQNLLDTISLRIEEWFSLTPMIKDVYVKLTMLKISCLVTIELMLSYLLFRLGDSESKRK